MSVVLFSPAEYEPCKRRILSFPSFPGLSPLSSEEEREMKISSMIPLESVVMVTLPSLLNCHEHCWVLSWHAPLSTEEATTAIVYESYL